MAFNTHFHKNIDRTQVMKKNLLYFMLLMMSSGVAKSSDFYADRLGGGASDALIDSAIVEETTLVSEASIHHAVSNNNGETSIVLSLDDDALVTLVTNNSAVENAVIYDIDSMDKNSRANSRIDAMPVTAFSSEGSNNQLQLPEGTWEIDLASDAGNDAFAIVDHTNSPYLLSVTENYKTTKNGSVLTIQAKIAMSSGIQNLNEGEAESNIGRVMELQDTEVSAEISFPDGRTETLLLKDDGLSKHGDSHSKDNIYSRKIELLGSGDFEINVKYTGMLQDDLIERTSVIHAGVDDARITAASNSVVATTGQLLDVAIEENRYGLPVDVKVTSGEMPDLLNSRADVWAVDAENGEAQLIGWIGGIIEPKRVSKANWQLPLSFHMGWLAEYDPGFVASNFWLDNIRLYDLDSGDQLYYGEEKISINNMHQNIQQANMKSADSSGRCNSDLLNTGAMIRQCPTVFLSPSNS